MKARDLRLSGGQNQGNIDRYIRILMDQGSKGSLVLVSCLLMFGCTTPVETRPEPSKEEIRGDADRFFEKMEQDKHGELKR